MDSGGAIFARIPLEKRDEFVKKASDKRSRWSDFKTLAARDGLDLVLLKRYNNRDDVPGWTPQRENAGDPLTVPNSALAEISVLGGEVIAFFWVEEWFDYQHWVSGKLVRFIDGGADGWDTVSGVPEPWESDCFFPAGSREKRLADLREGNELTPEREAAIAGAWSEKQVKSGAIEPPVDVRALLKALEKHFGIWLRD